MLVGHYKEEDGLTCIDLTDVGALPSLHLVPGSVPVHQGGEGHHVRGPQGGFT